MILKILLNFTDSNYEKLLQLKRNYKIPVTSLVNIIINEKIGSKIELLSKYKFENEKSEIKFRINDSEKEYLLGSIKITGTNSLTQEIRYRLLNSIYKDKILNPNEFESLNKLKYEINKIGINIYQILKKINANTLLGNDMSILKDNLEELEIKLSSTKIELENALKKNLNG